MNVKITLILAVFPVLFAGCGHVESHSRMVTHPTKVFGEYITQMTSTVDFTELEIPVTIPGRRPEHGSYPLKHNVILANRRNVIDIHINNPFDDVALAPQVVRVTFHDGPEGIDLETLTFESGVIGPGETVKGTLTASIPPPQGTYYWSYSLDRIDDWEEALQAYKATKQSAQEAASGAASLEAEDDEWDDEW